MDPELINPCYAAKKFLPFVGFMPRLRKETLKKRNAVGC
jgi:hypothetical protein